MRRSRATRTILCALLALPLGAAAQEKPPPAPAGPPTSVESNEIDDAEANRGRAPSRKSVTLSFGGGEVVLSFGTSKIDGRDYASIESLGDGEVVRFFDAAAVKLWTGIDLRFGDTVVRAENVAPDYPGVYSLWVERSGDGWRLLFNEKADVWGTRHDPRADVAGVPLVYTRVDGIAPRFQARLSASAQNDGSALLELHWGEHRWTTTFRPAEP